MDEQQKGAAENVVSGINKDFTIVGKHRVHSWYAWAIIGIVFGMALGIVYVANRSNQNVQFTKSDAAQVQGNQFSIVGAVEANSKIFATAMYKQGKWLADYRSKAVTTAGTVKVPNPGQTTASYGFNTYFRPYRGVGAVLLSPSGKFYVSNGTVINTTQPTGNTNTVYTQKFVAYLLKNGKKTALKVSGSFLPAIDVSGWDAGSRLQCVTNGGSLNVPGGIGYYASQAGQMPNGCERGMYFYDIPNGNKPAKHFRAFPILTPNAQSGTWEFVISERGNSYVIVSKVFTPKLSTGTVINDTDTETDASAVTTTRTVPPQCQPYVEDQDEMFFDCMNHPGSYRVRPAATNPTQVIPAQCKQFKNLPDGGETLDDCMEHQDRYSLPTSSSGGKPVILTPAAVAPAIPAICEQFRAITKDGGEQMDDCIENQASYLPTTKPTVKIIPLTAAQIIEAKCAVRYPKDWENYDGCVERQAAD